MRFSRHQSGPKPDHRGKPATGAGTWRVPAQVSSFILAALIGASGASGAEGDIPSREEMWRIIQDQQKQIEALREKLQQTGASEAQEPTAQPTRVEEHRAGRPADVDRRQQQEIEILKQRVAETDEKIEATAAVIEETQRQAGGQSWADRFALGGYGSLRFEANDLADVSNTFTYRRFVLTGDARPTDRLQAYVEIEFERFAELELEKTLASEADEPLIIEQAVEGTSESEIAFEQAWLRYQVAPGFNFEMGGILVPIGRFNLNHDDNQWNIPRRTLVDRGAPVLPVSAAWPELGLGFSGQSDLGDMGVLDYRFYVMNGAQLDFELEEEIESEIEDGNGLVKSVLKAEFGPAQGGFARDLNGNKAVTGRLAWQPRPGHEFAISAYHGRYTPSFLTDQSITSAAIDGIHTLGGFEIEYQGVWTTFNNVEQVGTSLALKAINKEGKIEGEFADAESAVEHEVEIELADGVLAKDKTGYWVELRYPFWPDSLNDTFLGRFAEPKLEPTMRFEQVFYNNLVQGLEFENFQVTEFETQDATLNRLTGGLAYRPSPLWVFSLFGEYTWTDEDSLAGLTNFLDAGADEDSAFALMFGAAFGF